MSPWSEGRVTLRKLRNPPPGVGSYWGNTRLRRTVITTTGRDRIVGEDSESSPSLEEGEKKYTGPNRKGYPKTHSRKRHGTFQSIHSVRDFLSSVMEGRSFTPSGDGLSKTTPEGSWSEPHYGTIR